MTIEASFFKVQIAFSVIACVFMLKKLQSVDDSLRTCAEKLTYMKLSAWRVVGMFFLVFSFTI